LDSFHTHSDVVIVTPFAKKYLYQVMDDTRPLPVEQVLVLLCAWCAKKVGSNDLSPEVDKCRAGNTAEENSSILQYHCWIQ